MKLLTLINQHWKNILIVALLVLLFIAFRQCKGATDKHKALAAATKSLEKKVQDAEAQRMEGRKQFEDYKKDAEGRQQLTAVEKAEADKKVTQQQKTIDRLASVIRSTTNQPVDSSFVLVSPDFKKACDSFPEEVTRLNLALADKDSSIAGMLDLYDYEIQIRDEEIYKEMQYSDSLRQDFNRQTALLKSALKQGKPRGKLLGGISVLGNQTNFLSGAGVVLAYQTKGGKQYQVSPKFIKTPGENEAQVYYEGTVLVTLFK